MKTLIDNQAVRENTALKTRNAFRDIFLRLKHVISGSITIKAGNLSIILDTIMLPLIPVTLWAIAAVYIPIMGTGLTSWLAWGSAAIILVFMFVSLFLHSLGHTITAGAFNKQRTGRIYLSPPGDPAQSQPAAPTAGKEALTALAGPFIQIIAAVIFYFLWNLQISEFFTSITFFLMLFNAGLAALNLAPVFPFDGGRLLRAAAWRLTGKPGTATKLAFYAGWGFCIVLLGWAIVLMAQQKRFSLETSLATFVICVLAAASLAVQKRWKWDRPETARQHKLLRTAGAFLCGLLMLPLAAITISLFPLNNGLEAPGFTASVEPMIQLPQEYRYTSSGHFLLLTVIPQAPILAGEWFYAQFDHSIKLVTPEQVVPKDQTTQSISAENYQMLLDSKTTAILVGLKLAGFEAMANNDGVSILSVVDDAPASSLLKPDDIITNIDGTAINTPEELTGYLKTLTDKSILDVNVRRGGESIGLSVPTMEPANAGGPVRIGISVVQHNDGFNLPFPIEINPQKVNGGPSAGLMFTVSVYDLVTPGDLTGGRTIAGTGTIEIDGRVGPIGGVQQKVVAAERAGATYFLCPAENYDEAVVMAKHIKVIKITTAQEAIDFLKSLAAQIQI